MSLSPAFLRLSASVNAACLALVIGWRIAISPAKRQRAAGPMAMISRICFQVAAVAACLIVPFVIGRRIALHPRVTLNTVAGAADIYLLFGLLFAVVYSLVGDVVLLWYPSLVANIGPTTTAAQAFFIAGRPPLPSDFMYYSFVTLTTVGYGDLTASTAIGRMLSVTEALVGQLYLVTVVAILVSNMGRSRNPASE